MNKDEVAANAYYLPSISQTIHHLHAAAGFPTKVLWIKAIKNGHYKTWPGIMAILVNKHYPDSIETQKGHMRKNWQNVRLTKQKVMVSDNTSEDDTSEDEELTRATTKHNVMIKIVNADTTLYTDQTGRFPIQSSKGNTSLMCTFDVNANNIDAEPLCNHSDVQMI